MSIKSLIIYSISLVFGTLLLSGCNTVQGMGKDMQEGGQKIQKAANQ